MPNTRVWPFAMRADVMLENFDNSLRRRRRCYLRHRNRGNRNVLAYPPLGTHRQHRRQQLAWCIGLIQQVMASDFERLVQTEDQLSARPRLSSPRSLSKSLSRSTGVERRR